MLRIASLLLALASLSLGCDADSAGDGHTFGNRPAPVVVGFGETFDVDVRLPPEKGESPV